MAKDWTSERIKEELRKRGTSLGEVNTLWGYASGTIYNVFRSAHPIAERIIADIVGVEPQDIWPSRYESDGWPRGLRGLRPLFELKKTNGNVKTGEAA